MRGRALAAALLLLVASTCARATIWERPLGPYGVFRVDLPSGWTAKLQEPDAGVVAPSQSRRRPAFRCSCSSARFPCPTTSPTRCSRTAPAARSRGCRASPRSRRSRPSGSRARYPAASTCPPPTSGSGSPPRRTSSTESRATWSPGGCSPRSRSSPICRAVPSATARSRSCARPGTSRPRCRCSTTREPCRSPFPTALGAYWSICPASSSSRGSRSRRSKAFAWRAPTPAPA